MGVHRPPPTPAGAVAQGVRARVLAKAVVGALSTRVGETPAAEGPKRSQPERLACPPGTLHQRTQLRPHDAGDHDRSVGDVAEAAVHASHHAL